MSVPLNSALRLLHHTAALAVLVGVTLATGACVPPAPHLATPPPISSTSWVSAGSEERLTGEAATEFWSAFNSAQLRALIGEGLAGNASLDVMVARVLSARMQERGARAALLPTASLSVGASQTSTNVTNSSAFAYSQSSASLDIGWDTDLFGAAHKTARAAGSRALAARFDERAARLAVATDIARQYIELAADNARLSVTDSLLTDAREVARIAALRVREGSASPLDAERQLLELRKLEADRVRQEQTQRMRRSAMAVLLGREAPGLQLDPEPIDALAVPTLDAGQPSDLLLRRPDLLAAEARIAAANGDVAAARAAFLPGLRINANGLGQALALAGPYGLTSTLGLNVVAPIFSGGRLRAQLGQASAAQMESVAFYREVMLKALEEGCNALAAIDLSREHEVIERSALDSAERALHLSQAQYREGEIDMSALLDTRRARAQALLATIDARRDRLVAAIDLFKALGGAPNELTNGR